MPIPFAITAISGSYPDIAVNPVKKFYEKKGGNFFQDNLSTES